MRVTGAAAFGSPNRRVLVAVLALWMLSFCESASGADTTPPQVQITQDLSSGPIGHGTYPVRVQATDVSGISSARIWHVGSSERGELKLCNPLCSPLDHTFQYVVDSEHDGAENEVGIYVTDGAQNQTQQILTYDVDAGSPTLSLSGPVRDGYLDADGTWELVMAASDDPVGSSPSGVARLEVFVDGASRFLRTQNCSDCQMPNEVFQWDTLATGLGFGTHQVRVEAEDVAGNVATQAFAVLVDPNATPSNEFDVGGGDDAMDAAGYPPCTVDPETGDDYCGENDAPDPDDAFAQQQFAPFAATIRRIGFADQGTDVRQFNFFADPRVRDLQGFDIARLIVPWNLVSRAEDQAGCGSTGACDTSSCTHPACNELRKVDAWLREAKAAGFSEALLSLNATYLYKTQAPHSNVAPTVDDYVSAARRIHRRYEALYLADTTMWPRVDSYGAWNEPNNRNVSPDAIVSDPAIPARYARRLAKFCAGNEGPGEVKCRVIGGDFSEDANLRASGAGYMRRYKAALRGYVPRQWAIHSYGCPTGNGLQNDETDDVLRSFIAATRRRADVSSPDDPYIWITETGPRVDLRLRGKAITEATLDDLDAVSRDRVVRLFDHCMQLSTRVRRVYLYEWNGSASFDRDGDGIIEKKSDTATDETRFDAGFTDVYRPISGAGEPLRLRSREAYCVLHERFGPPSTPCPGR